MKKNYLAILGIILLIIILVLSFILGRTLAQKENQIEEENIDITLLDNFWRIDSTDEIDNYEDKVSLVGIAKTKKELKSMLYDPELFEELDDDNLNFNRYNFILIESIEDCSEDYSLTKTRIVNDKITLHYEADYHCGVCGSTKSLYAIEIPKSIDIKSEIKIKIEETEYPICDGDIDY